MSENTINAQMLSHMFLSAVENLQANQEYVNELNVFPVPDGDTGTNMTLTILSAAQAVEALSEPKMPELAQAISSGSLRGARGNSGVILSQLLRGFCKSISDLNEIAVDDLRIAFEKATETAYKAVMKPKEGTILTVARGISEAATELAENCESMDAFLSGTIEAGDRMLEQTPEMLPVLKEAGVVDSGGMGLILAMKGALDGYRGKEVAFTAGGSPAKSAAAAYESEQEIKFGYCTEFIIELSKEFNDNDEKEFKSFLSSIGDSIVCVADDEIVKIHVHTNDPGEAIQKALTYGQLTRIKIDNMRKEHEERLIKAADLKEAPEQPKTETNPVPANKNGMIAVACGDGFVELFEALSCDYVIRGGQTMNPSTEDMLLAIEQVNAENIYILPNNKNIIMAARQAAQVTEDRNVVVIESTTIPQGISAAMYYDPEQEADINTEAMRTALDVVNSGEVTYAVRSTKIDGIKIKKGDYMGIGDSGILSTGKDLDEVTLELIRAISEDRYTISVYYGIDVSPEEAEHLVNKAQDLFPDKEILSNPGGQPIYSYIIGAE